jgi:hypothetical protein
MVAVVIKKTRKGKPPAKPPAAKTYATRQMKPQSGGRARYQTREVKSGK